MGNVQEMSVLDQQLEKTFIYQMLEERRDCMVGLTWILMEADLHARITAAIQTSGILALIGSLVKPLACQPAADLTISLWTRADGQLFKCRMA